MILKKTINTKKVIFRIATSLFAVFFSALFVCMCPANAFGRSLSNTYELPEAVDASSNGMKAAGGRMYVPNKDGQRIFVIEKGKGLIDTIEFDTPGGLISLDFVPQDNYMYVAIENENVLHLIETEGNLFLMSIALPFSPISISVSTESDELTVVSSNGEYLVVNRRSGETIRSGSITATSSNILVSGTNTLTWSSDGNEVSVFSTLSGKLTDSYRVSGKIVEVVGNGNETCVLTDSDELSVYDASGALKGKIPVTDGQHISISENSIFVQEKRGSTVNSYDISTLELVETISSAFPSTIVGSDGQDYFAAKGNFLYSTDNVFMAPDVSLTPAISTNENTTFQGLAGAAPNGIVALGPGSVGSSPLSKQPNVLYYKSDGDGTFSFLSSTPVNYKFRYNYVSSLTLNNYDNDSSIDFTYNYLDSYVFFNGESTPSFYYDILLTGVRMDHLLTTSGDFDNDGDEDYIVVPYQVVYDRNTGNQILKAMYFRNEGNRNFDVVHYNLNVSGWPERITYYFYDIEAIDVEGDGNLDIALSSYWKSSALMYMGGNGDGTFSLREASLINYISGYMYPAPIAVADFDADGKEDIAQFMYNSSRRRMDIILFKNVGNGDFEQNGVVETSMIRGNMDMDAYDFNGDGLPDILTSGLMNLYVNKGNWGFEEITDTGLPSFFSMAVLPIRKSALFLYANAGEDMEGVVGWPVNYDAGASGGNGVELVEYLWDFGDGETGEGVSATHNYQAAGVYTVTLTVRDTLGRVAKDTLVVNVKSVDAGPNRTIMAGGTVDLYTPQLPGGDIDYSWEMGDGNSMPGASVSYTYPDRGVYEAKVTASGPGGSDSDVAYIRVMAPLVPVTEYVVVSTELFKNPELSSEPYAGDSGHVLSHNHLYYYLLSDLSNPVYLGLAPFRTTTLRIEDFDGDGDYDFIASGNDKNVYLYTDDSSATTAFPNFTKKLIKSFPELRDTAGKIIPWESQSAGGDDLDGDGDMDFVFYTQYRFYTFLNDGYGNFKILDQNPGYNLSFFGLDTGDVNGDSFPDIVTTTKDQVLYFSGDGKGNWGAAKEVGSIPKNMKNPPTVRVADFNNDGILDIIVGGSGSPLAIFIGNGKGDFTKGAPVVSGITSASIADVSDYDGDGDIDLLVAGGGSFKFYSMTNDGNAGFSSASSLDSTLFGYQRGITTPPYHFAGAPIPLDRFAVLVSNKETAPGTFANQIFLSAVKDGFPPAAPTPVSMASGSSYSSGRMMVSPSVDLDNDGDLDFVGVNVANSGTCAVLRFMNDGAAQFTASVVTTVCDGTGVEIVDLNNDLYPDIVVSKGASEFRLLINDTTAGFSSFDVSTDGDSFYKFELADVNSDGYEDIITSFISIGGAPGNNDVHVLYGVAPAAPGGAQSFVSAPVVLVSAPFAAGGSGSGYPTAIMADDFDGDGDVDLALGSDHTTGLIYLNNGTGGFSAPAGYPSFSLDETGFSDTGFRVGDSMDVDGDEIVDLLIGMGYRSPALTPPAVLPYGYIYLKGLGSGNFEAPQRVELAVRYDAVGAVVPNLLPLLPDLVVSRVVVLPKQNPAPYSDVTLRVYVKNTGSVAVRLPLGTLVPVRVRVVLEGVDLLFDVGGSPGSLLYVDPAALVPGGEGFVQVSLPSCEAGLYVVKVQVDMESVNVVSELEEMGNNERSSSFIVGDVVSPDFIDVSCKLKTDLYRRQFTISGHAQYSMDWTPPEMASNNAVTVSLWKEGVGFVDKYRWSALDGLNLYTNGSGNYSWGFPTPTSGGLYTAFVDVFDGSVHGYCDESFVVPEQENLALNCKLYDDAGKLFTNYGGTYQVTGDMNLKVQTNVYNVGYEDVPGGIPVSYSLTDVTDGASDLLLSQSFSSTTPLASGDKWTDDSFIFSMNERKTCYNVYVEVNPGQGFMKESRMTDNVCDFNVCRIDSPDLVAHNLYSYDPVDVGSTPALLSSFKNHSSWDTENDFLVQLVQVNKDNSEIVVASKTVYAPMAAWTVDNSAPASWPAPGGGAWTVPAGDVVKYLRLTVDVNNDVLEGWTYGTSGYHESNNVRFLYPPDVVVGGVTMLASACAGTPVSSNYPMGGFNVTVGHNIHRARMVEGAYTVKTEVFYKVPATGVWVSILTWNDTATGKAVETLKFPKTGAIVASNPAYVSVDTVANTVTLIEAGDYKVVVVADPNSEKLDENRANNTLERLFTVTESYKNLSAWSGWRTNSNYSSYYYRPRWDDIKVSNAPMDRACQGDIQQPGSIPYTSAAFSWFSDSDVRNLKAATSQWNASVPPTISAIGYNAGTKDITDTYWVLFNQRMSKGPGGNYGQSSFALDADRADGIGACSWPEKEYSLLWDNAHGAMEPEGGDPGRLEFWVDWHFKGHSGIPQGLHTHINDESREDDNQAVLYFNDLKMTDATFTPHNPFVPGSPGSGQAVTFVPNICVVGHMQTVDWRIGWKVNYVENNVILGNAIANGWTDVAGYDSPTAQSQRCQNLPMTNWGPGLDGGGLPGAVTMPELSAATTAGLTITTDAAGHRGYWIRFTANMDVMRCVPEKYELNNSYTKDFFVHESLPNLTPWRDTHSYGSHRPHYSDVELVVTPAAAAGPDCTDVPVQDGSTCTGIRAIIRNTGEKDATGVRAVLYRKDFTPIDPGIPLIFNLSAGATQNVLYNQWLPESDDDSLTIRVLYSGTEMNPDDNETEREIPDINLYDVKP